MPNSRTTSPHRLSDAAKDTNLFIGMTGVRHAYPPRLPLTGLRCRQHPIMTSHFSYRVGGGLAWNDPTYIGRQADRDLLDALQHGHFAYVLGPRQVGKSSLRIQTRHRLTQLGYQCVTIHANQLTDSLQNDDAASWQMGLICAIWEGLYSTYSDGFLQWVQATAGLSGAAEGASSQLERLENFVQAFLVTALEKASVVILIDEVDALLDSPFAYDFFSWVERCHGRRVMEPAFRNLNFAVFGTAISDDFPCYKSLFSLGCRIDIAPFTLVETYALNQGFEGKVDEPTMLVKSIYRWAQGQPFLTQKLCRILRDLLNSLIQTDCAPLALSMKTIDHWVDESVRSHIIQDWPTQDDPVHLRAIGDRLTRSPNRKALLTLYKRVLLDSPPVPACASYTQAELLLSGIVIVQGHHLAIANNIYRHVFALK